MKEPARIRTSKKMKATSVDEYLASLSPHARPALMKLRRRIRSIVPEAAEVISYGIPTFKLDRMLVAYAAFRDHYSFFPLSSRLLDRYRREAARYQTSKGTLRFAFDEPLPESLIRKIVSARIRELRNKGSLKTDVKRTVSSAGRFSLPLGLAKPAQRTLAKAGITNLEQLSRWRQDDIKELHGIGPNAMALIRKVLRSNRLSFAGSRTSKRNGGRKRKKP
jgi:uncharacterized protein YdhG (YjbR/CyaY superfamily)